GSARRGGTPARRRHRPRRRRAAGPRAGRAGARRPGSRPASSVGRRAGGPGREDRREGRDRAPERFDLGFEVGPPGGGHAVVAGPPVVLGDAPGGGEQPGISPLEPQTPISKYIGSTASS